MRKLPDPKTRHGRELLEDLARRDREERAACTFQPRTNQSRKYEDVSARYMDPPSLGLVTMAAQTDDSVGVVTNPPAAPKAEDTRVTLNEFVTSRLDAAAAFYEEYRSEMKQLKGYHLNLMKLRHELQHQSA
jgi:hypothetical protein